MNRQQKIIGLITLILLAIAHVLNLDIVPLYLEEPRRAIIALEMILRDNYLEPTYYGVDYTFKPPMFNWLIVAGYKLFNTYSEYIPRLISVFSLFGIAIANFFWVKKYHDERLAWYSSIFFILSIDLLFYFSLFGEIDLFYSFISYLSIITIHHFYEAKKRVWLYTIPFILAAIGFLTKGFPSIVFIGITFLVVAITNKDCKAILQPLLPVGILLFVLIAGSYFYAYSLENDVWKFLDNTWDQAGNRVTGAEIKTGFLKKIGRIVGHFALFPFETLLNLIPASLFLVFAFNKEVRNEIKQHPFLKTVFWILLANILLYWIAPGTRARYVYMLYPFAVILLSSFLVYGVGQAPKLNKIFEWLWGILIGITAAGLLALWKFEPISDLPNALMLSIGFAVVYLIVLLAYIKLPSYRWDVLIIAIIISRIGFDFIALPLRASSGEITQSKHHAYEMLEIVGDEPLHFYKFKNSGYFSLTTAFYLEAEKEQMLTIHEEKNCSDYFIAIHWDFEENDKYDVYYEYEWRGKKYYLVKFKDCNS